MILTNDNPLHDRILHKPCKTVKNFETPEILLLTQDMAKIASHPGAAGVAAPQLGKSLKIFALNTNKKYPVLFFFNPRIVSMSEETYEIEEGCLSVPGKVCKVTRHKEVTLAWQDSLGKKIDPSGRKYEFTFSGFEAQATQHEFDHISSTLIVDIAEQTFDAEQFKKAFENRKSLDNYAQAIIDKEQTQ